VFEFWLKEMPSELGTSVLVEAVFVGVGVLDVEAEGVWDVAVVKVTEVPVPVFDEMVIDVDPLAVDTDIVDVGDAEVAPTMEVGGGIGVGLGGGGL
jgi:hypothetical protein